MFIIRVGFALFSKFFSVFVFTALLDSLSKHFYLTTLTHRIKLVSQMIKFRWLLGCTYSEKNMYYKERSLSHEHTKTNFHLRFVKPHNNKFAALLCNFLSGWCCCAPFYLIVYLATLHIKSLKFRIIHLARCCRCYYSVVILGDFPSFLSLFLSFSICLCLRVCFGGLRIYFLLSSSSNFMLFRRDFFFFYSILFSKQFLLLVNTLIVIAIGFGVHTKLFHKNTTLSFTTMLYKHLFSAVFTHTYTHTASTEQPKSLTVILCSNTLKTFTLNNLIGAFAHKHT